MPTDDHADWARELLEWWQLYNDDYLAGALRQPTLRIASGGSQLGSWCRDTRTLSFYDQHIRGDPWTEVLETLRHEMAHQYADEVLGAVDEPPHGPTFQSACQRLFADPRATADRRIRRAAPAPAGSEDPILARVHKLLSLGSSPNEHEAQVAIAKARELLLKHNLADVRQGGRRRFGVRWLGPVRGRHHLHEHVLAGILTEFFCVRALWCRTYDATRHRDASVLEVCGTERALDMADYVHGYLSQLLPRLWDSYKRERRLRSDRERLRYFAGVLHGFRDRLRKQERATRGGTALVPHSDPELEAHFAARHPRVRTTSVGAVARTEAYDHAVATGRTVSLHQPVSSGGKHRGGNLLPPAGQSGQAAGQR